MKKSDLIDEENEEFFKLVELITIKHKAFLAN